MCEPVTLSLIAAGLSAAGSGAGMYSQHQQLAKQDQIAAQGIARQAQINSQSGQQVNKLVSNIAKSDPQAAIAKQNAAYAAALSTTKNAQGAADPTLPGASTKYNTAAADARGNVDAYGKSQAGIMSRTDAPFLQRLNESEQIGDTAGNLGLLGGQSQSQSALTADQIKSVGQNPWLGALGGVLRGAGAGVGSYGASRAYTGAGATGDKTLYSTGPTPTQDPNVVGYSGAYKTPWGP